MQWWSDYLDSFFWGGKTAEFKWWKREKLRSENGGI